MRTARLQVPARAGLLVAVAVLLAHVRLSGRPRTLCLLRAATGIPCPLCGGTTAAVRLGGGDLLGALRASPLAVAGGAVVAAVPLLRNRVPARASLPVVLAALAASEIWQLHRFALV